MLSVKKRDGRVVPFNMEKVYSAVYKCTKDKEISEDVSDIVCKALEGEDVVSVNSIQNIVEDTLMKKGYFDFAKSYICYRYLHDVAREKYNKLTKTIEKKLYASDVQNQNANIDEKSFGGRRGEVANAVLKRYALDNCMSKKARNNHESNEIYIHDLDSYALGMHNCYDSNTRFITYDGVRSFKSCNDGEVVKVLSIDGEWRKATVHKYGKQKMYRLTFKSSLTRKTVICTRNHRWVLDNGTVVDNINVGDSLALTPKVKNNEPINNNLWCIGFVLGDGCDIKLWSKGRTHITNGAMKIRLCGDKVKYLQTFLECGWSETEHFDNGDVMVYTSKYGEFKQKFLDNELWKVMSHNDLISIFNGYIDADGFKYENGSVNISTSDKRLLEFIRYASSPSGYFVWSQKHKRNNTNFKSDRELWEVYLVEKQSNKWTLEKIESCRHAPQTAWCVEEPVTHTFTLDGAMVTGNCLSVPFDKLLREGFSTRQTSVRPAKSVSTASQLIAVIFQIVSLNQFGGVSATHLDWTLVPYVRMSFYKHYLDGMEFVENKKFTDKFNEDISIEDEYYKNNEHTYNYAVHMLKKEIYQAMEGMFHNLNTLQSRSGNQLPFTSINYGTCTLPEGRLVTEAILNVSIKGIGKLHKTSIFPCQIFTIKDGVNKHNGEPNYDLFLLALKSTAKRLYPNYCNDDWSVQKGAVKSDREMRKSVIDSLTDEEKEKLKKNLTYESCKYMKLDKNLNIDMTEDLMEQSSTMGCRTWNGYDINYKKIFEKNIHNIINNKPLEYTEFTSGAQKDGRGNICPVTIILPELAQQVVEKYGDMPKEERIKKFMHKLDKKIHEAKDMLIERNDYICKQSESAGKFMWENDTMFGYDHSGDISSAILHGTLAIGQISLAETLQILIGKDQTTEEGMNLAIKIEKLFNKRCDEFKHEYNLNFGVYYTPAENLCHTAMDKFKEKHGVIKNVSDKEYFTNSMHVPVYDKVDVFEKIDIESKLTGYSNAGCIMYTELDSSAVNNIKALEKIVIYAMDKDIPYFAINVPNDTCNDCGYSGDFKSDVCPVCGGINITRLRRVTGKLVR